MKMNSAKDAWIQSAVFLAPLLCLAAIAGCGPAKARINGKVVASGQPVTEGTVTFAPLAPTEGAPAIGQVKSDGTFVLGTAGQSDGAVVGKHAVRYAPPIPEGPEWDGYGERPPVKISPFANMIPSVGEIEVKAGTNEITIELVPAPPSQNPGG